MTGGAGAYWRSSLRAAAAILAAWAAVSLVGAVLLADPLDRVRLGAFPLGFWLGQQGAVVAFVALVWIFVAASNAVDRRHGGGDRR